MFHWRCRGFFRIGLACVVWIASALAVHAEVQQARDPIFDLRTQTLLENVQSAGTDLPISLSSNRDIYLFVTAGAAYTDIRALALPSVPAATLAEALAASTAGTALAGRDVTWSSDDYSAAALTVSHGHFFRSASANTVPVGPLIIGLRRAGFVPHCLLRVPIYASAAGLPPPCRPPNHWRWYDQAQAASLGTITVRAKLSLVDALLPILFVVLAAGLTSLGFLMARRVVRDERLSVSDRRQRSTRWAMLPVFLTFPIYMPLMVFYERSFQGQAIADIWFGSATVAALIPIFLIGPLSYIFVLPFTLRAQRKHLPAIDAPVQAAMTPQEKAIRQRMARWQMGPHLLIVLGAVGSLWFLPHRSPLYNTIHPVLNLLTLPLAALVALAFKKQLSAFTRVTVDDDLTWRARQLGMQMGVRLQDVKLEDSTAASVYATISTEAGRHLKLSRKMVELLSPEEMDYVLARQIALMKTRMTGTGGFLLLNLFPMFVVVGGLMWGMLKHPATGVTLMPWFLPVAFVLTIIPVFFGMKLLTRSTVAKSLEAHKDALSVTNNIPVARSALLKIAQCTPVQTTQAEQAQKQVMKHLEALQAEKAATAPAGDRC